METRIPVKKPLGFHLADLHLEGLIVWTILSVVTAGILLMPFLADSQFILEHTPTCISQQQFHVECILCGMTRAFIAIAAGHFAQARALNGGSLVLYAGFLVNSALYLSRGLPAVWRIARSETRNQR